MSREFEKIVSFEPVWVNENTKEIWIRFVLKGEKGAVQFLMSSGWNTSREPSAFDLGYHSPKPLNEGWEAHYKECSILGGECYYDGSSLNAEPILERLLKEGDKAVWEELEKYYKQVFREEEERDKYFGLEVEKR